MLHEFLLVTSAFRSLDKDKSNALNKFFSSVFTTEDPNTVSSFHADKNDDISLSSIITINPSVVFEHLKSLKCGEAPGWPVEVFKKCADHLCTP